ncbi:MAG: hypothetical protein MJ070_01665 [Lachnospiraceae bacterium]|nr:hypothetical protein [Lachnospiraceae bacterium]
MKKLTALLLALLTVCSSVIVLASCADGKEPGKGTEPVTRGETQPPEESGSGYDKSDLPDSYDLDGYLFRFMYTEDPLSLNMMFPEESIAEPVNDAMYSRNQSLSEKYNFEIENNNLPVDALKSSIAAQDDLFDVCSVFLTTAVSKMLESYFYDMNDVVNLNLTKNYWDQNFNEQMSIGDALYYVCGDIGVADDDKLMVIMYNREMADDYGIENLYDVAYAGNWTYDLMAKYAKQVASDLNYDNKIDENDVVGFMYASNNLMPPHLAACLTNLCVKDDFDLPMLVDDFEPFIAVCDKISGIFDDTLAFDWLEMGSAQVAGIQSLVNTKHVLFQNMILSQLRRLYRDIEAGFGILPMPKYDDLQDAYSTSIYVFDVLTIPNTNRHLAETGFILEALAAGSEQLTDSYYHKCLESKFVRDEESFDMINMMRSNVTYDLAYYCDFGGLYNAISNSFLKTKNSNEMVSTIASKLTAAEDAVERFISYVDAF